MQKEVLQAVVEPQNLASMRILDSVGFVRGELDERAYEVEGLDGKRWRWVAAHTFLLRRSLVVVGEEGRVEREGS